MLLDKLYLYNVTPELEEVVELLIFQKKTVKILVILFIYIYRNKITKLSSKI